jgi:general secretion pathway protein I
MTCASTGSPDRSPSTTDRPGGFTLLEVLVAFAVLALALGASFEIFATGMRGTQSAEALTRAVLVAESRLAGVGTEIELRPSAVEGETHDGIEWRVEIAEPTPPDDDDPRLDTPSLPILLGISVTVVWQDRGGRQSFALHTQRLAPGAFE